MLSKMLVPNALLLLYFLSLLPLWRLPKLVQLSKKAHSTLPIACKGAWTTGTLS